MVDETYDVLVVGGGAAGLSGALALARARRSVLVMDAGEPRNSAAGHVHNYLAREGMPPAELLAAGREEVACYGGQIVAGRVEAAARHRDGFQVRLHGGRRVRARRLLVTTGLVDELPEVPGVAERWGRDVLGCPYCHGWEVRGRRIGVLATGPLAPDQASLWRQWSSQVMLVTHHTAAPGAGEAERLAARGITIVAGPVAALEVADDTLTGVRLASAQVVALDTVVVSPRLTARAGVLQSLGLKPVDAVLNGHVIGSQIPADPTGATAVPGAVAASRLRWVVMPANRMNRDEFYTAMAPNDDARLRKILWTLYWRGNAQLRERIEDELRLPEQPKSEAEEGTAGLGHRAG